MNDEGRTDYALAWYQLRNHRSEAAASLGAIVGLAVFVGGMAFPSLALTVLGAFFGLACWLGGRFARVERTRGTLRLTDDGVAIGDLALGRDEVRTGYRTSDRGVVLTATGNRELHLRFASDHDGEPGAVEGATDDPVNRTLDHLSRSLRLRALRVPLGEIPSSAITSFAAWLFLQPVGCLGGCVLGWHTNGIQALILFAGVFAIPLLLARWLGRRGTSIELVIGSEGILADRTFVHYGAMRGIELEPETPNKPPGILIRRTERRDLRIQVKGVSPEQMAGIQQRIREGFAAHVAKGDRGSSAVEASLLHRGDLTVSEWRRQLLRPANADVGFRQAALPTEDAIARVLDNGARSLEERVGAALVLRNGSFDDRVRIRVAAEASVDPELQRALRIVLADEIDDAALAEVLEKPRFAR